MHLRHEALRAQIDRLAELLSSLKLEVAESVAANLKDRVRQLEGVLDELKRQAVG